MKGGDDNFIVMGLEKLNNFEENKNGIFYFVWVVMSDVEVSRTYSLLEMSEKLYEIH